MVSKWDELEKFESSTNRPAVEAVKKTLAKIETAMGAPISHRKLALPSDLFAEDESLAEAKELEDMADELESGTPPNPTGAAKLRKMAATKRAQATVSPKTLKYRALVEQFNSSLCTVIKEAFWNPIEAQQYILSRSLDLSMELLVSDPAERVKHITSVLTDAYIHFNKVSDIVRSYREKIIKVVNGFRYVVLFYLPLYRLRSRTDILSLFLIQFQQQRSLILRKYLATSK